MLVALLAGADGAAAEDRGDAPRGVPATVLERWREATPEQRLEMRENLRERFENATPRQRRRIERRHRRLRALLPDFSPIERMILLRAAAALPKAERASLRRRIGRIDQLEVAERKALIAELEGMIEHYSDELERLERNKQRWEALSEAEQEEYRAQMKRLRSMSLDERRALLEEMKSADESSSGSRADPSHDPDAGRR